MTSRFRFAAIVAALLLAALVPTASVGHSKATNDTDYCPARFNVRLVVFEHADLAGVNDDWCVEAWGSFGNEVDETWCCDDPGDDIGLGGGPNMDNRVSSFSIRNNYSLPICLRMYWEPFNGGNYVNHRVDPGDHDHINLAFFWNDMLSSSKIIWPAGGATATREAGR